MLTMMLVMGIIGGGIWALLPALLRARGLMNEKRTTLLLNVVILIVDIVLGLVGNHLSHIFRNRKSFPTSAHLPTIGGTRLHYGIFIALVAAIGLYFVLKFTRWGYEMRAIGGNWRPPNAPESRFRSTSSSPCSWAARWPESPDSARFPPSRDASGRGFRRGMATSVS